MSTQPQWRYTLSKPTLREEEASAVRDVVLGGWLSMGPLTAQFETAFAEKLGAKFAVAVSNGTAALHLAYLALGLGPGDEVIQPSITFVASANMTLATGAKPVFADIISPLEPTIDPRDVERRITKRTKAVVVMHYGGYPAHLAELKAICDAHDIALIEDACHGPAQRVPSLNNRALGTIGDVGTFSFFANKNMTTGEGGMIVTDNEAIAQSARLLRSHGMSSATWERHNGAGNTYEVLAHGFNYRINEICATLGLHQLGKLDDANERRRAIAVSYAKTFAEIGLEGVEYVFGSCPKEGAGHIAAVLLPEGIRDEVRNDLKAARIQTSMHYPPIHNFGVYREFATDTALPMTDAFAHRAASLPIHPFLRTTDVEEIAHAVAASVSK